MSGLAIGMCLEGFLPVIYFERHDFMLVAADAIVNHIDKIERISHGEFKVPVIMRACDRRRWSILFLVQHTHRT